MADADDEVKVDLKITSTTELQEALQKINSILESRKEPSNEQMELISFHLKHIENELNGPAVVTEVDRDLPPLSLEHLELYQSYLSRVVPPKDLVSRHQAIEEIVDQRLKSHPNFGMARSGDKRGNEAGGAVLKVPMGRRRQTCVMLYLNFLTGPLFLFLTLLLVYKIVPYSGYLFLMYAAWVTYDNMTLKFPSDHRISQKWRDNVVYRLFRDYFPIRMIKANQNAEFSPKKNFLFGYHPHGVQAAGALAFASSACGFDELFPGLVAHVQTLAMNWKLPGMRETLLWTGAGNASRECLKETLKPSSPGSSVVLVTGGALESMYAQPYTSKVVMQTRAGFVKIALQTGASLVPVWGFGENSLYENLAAGSPTVLKYQRKIQQMISFAPLLVAGRGVFSYSGGLLPRRRPISIVVGEPIDVGSPDPNPSNERVAEVHGQYKAALLQLFERHKDIYDPKARPIEFI